MKRRVALMTAGIISWAMLLAAGSVYAGPTAEQEKAVFKTAVDGATQPDPATSTLTSSPVPPTDTSTPAPTDTSTPLPPTSTSTSA